MVQQGKGEGREGGAEGLGMGAGSGQRRRQGLGPVREGRKIRHPIGEEIEHDRFRIHGEGIVPKQLEGGVQPLGQARQIRPRRIEQGQPLGLRGRRKTTI